MISVTPKLATTGWQPFVKRFRRALRAGSAGIQTAEKMRPAGSDITEHLQFHGRICVTFGTVAGRTPVARAHFRVLERPF
jgi:hypothetical protein